MGKNLLLGALGGGALSGLLAAIAMGLFAAMDGNAEMTIVMALSSGVVVAFPGAALGAVAGALSPTWPRGKIALLGAALAGGLGTFVALSLIAMAKGNWVIGLMLAAASLVGGYVVAALVARWRGAK